MNKIKGITTTLNIGFMSGFTLKDFYSLCNRYDLEIISCTNLGGFFVKSYLVTVEGHERNINKLSLILSNL